MLWSGVWLLDARKHGDQVLLLWAVSLGGDSN